MVNNKKTTKFSHFTPWQFSKGTIDCLLSFTSINEMRSVRISFFHVSDMAGSHTQLAILLLIDLIKEGFLLLLIDCKTHT